MNRSSVWITLIISLVLLAAICGLTYGCTQANNRYYEQAKNCTANGGSFIPIPGQGGGSSMCLMGRTQMDSSK